MTSKRKATDDLPGHVPKLPLFGVSSPCLTCLPPLIIYFQQNPTRESQSTMEDPGHKSFSNEKYNSGIPPKDNPSSKTLEILAPVRQDRVYRVRGLPGDFNHQATTTLISILFNLESNISLPRIRSLARTLDGRMMVATLSFRISPRELSSSDSNEWSFDITDCLSRIQAGDEYMKGMDKSRTLTIDDHFCGFTVLSSPPPTDHRVEYVSS
jgi:hypothetical protein